MGFNPEDEERIAESARMRQMERERQERIRAIEQRLGAMAMHVNLWGMNTDDRRQQDRDRARDQLQNEIVKADRRHQH